MQPLPERIKRADKDDVAFFELTVISATLDQVQVDHPLVIPGPFRQVLVVGCLHLAVEYRILVILAIDIEADAFPVCRDLDRLLLFHVYKTAYLFPYDQLQHLMAKVRIICQDFAEHEIIRKAQLFVFLCIHMLVPPLVNHFVLLWFFGGIHPDVFDTHIIRRNARKINCSGANEIRKGAEMRYVGYGLTGWRRGLFGCKKIHQGF